jgi:hypothetical protein
MGKRINVTQILKDICDLSAEERSEQLTAVETDLVTSLNSVKRELNLLEGRMLEGHTASTQQWAKLRSAARTISQKLERVRKALAEVKQELAVPPLSEFFMQAALRTLPYETFADIEFEAANIRELAKYEARNRNVCV